MPGYEWIGTEEKNQVNEVMQTGVLFRYEFKNERNGIHKVREFEEKFASFHGAGYAHAVTSGTAALKVALAALGVAPGDEVITQGFTFIATFEAIIEAGAIPVPAEIDETLNMNPGDLEKKITDRTRAVIPVHMLGSPARIKEICAIARKNHVFVIEDTAQALGAEVDGRKVGTWGDMGTFSFDFYKTITTGEGGMVVTNDKELYMRSSEYADHGHDHNPAVGRALEGRRFLGFNFRMTELSGAIGLAQLSRIGDLLRRQEQNQAPIRKALEGIRGIKMRDLPEGGKDSFTHVCFLLEDEAKASEFHRRFTERGFSAIYFKNNLWHFLANWEHLIGLKTAWAGRYPFLGKDVPRGLKFSADMLPQSAGMLERLVVIPVSLKMDSATVDRIVGGLRETAAEVL